MLRDNECKFFTRKMENKIDFNYMYIGTFEISFYRNSVKKVLFYDVFFSLLFVLRVSRSRCYVAVNCSVGTGVNLDVRYRKSLLFSWNIDH